MLWVNPEAGGRRAGLEVRFAPARAFLSPAPWCPWCGERKRLAASAPPINPRNPLLLTHCPLLPPRPSSLAVPWRLASRLRLLDFDRAVQIEKTKNRRTPRTKGPIYMRKNLIDLLVNLVN